MIFILVEIISKNRYDVFLGTWKNEYQDGTIKTGIWENDNFISSSIFKTKINKFDLNQIGINLI